MRNIFTFLLVSVLGQVLSAQVIRHCITDLPTIAYYGGGSNNCGGGQQWCITGINSVMVETSLGELCSFDNGTCVPIGSQCPAIQRPVQGVQPVQPSQSINVPVGKNNKYTWDPNNVSGNTNGTNKSFVFVGGNECQYNFDGPVGAVVSISVDGMLNSTHEAVGTLAASISGGPLTICGGGSVSLTANCTSGDCTNLTYSWSGPGVFGQTTPTVNFTPASSGTYSVTIYNGFGDGCQATASVNVVVNGGVSTAINASPSTAVCPGATVNLSANCTGNCTGVTYNWSNGASGFATTVNPATTTPYTVTVTNSAGCSAIQTYTVTVNTPSVSIAGGSLKCANAAPYTLTASGANTYTWSTGANTTSISVPAPIAPSTSTNYSVTGTDATGCTATASTTIDVVQLEAVASPASICVGSLSTLSVNCSGTCTGLGYTWSTGATTPTITVSPGTTQNYTVSVTHAPGCTTVRTVTVNVSGSLSVNIAGSNTFCPGSSTTISVTPAASTYAWSSGQNTQAITVNTAGTYTVTATSASGCTGTASVNVSAGSGFAISIAGALSICSGQSTTISVTPAGSTYVWSPGGQNTQAITVNPGSNTTYLVTATDANGCSGTASATVSVTAAPSTSISGTLNICNGQSTTLTASGAGPYSWSTGATSSSITVSPTTNTNYSVVVGTGSCTATAASVVTVNANPTPNITGTSTICNGASTTLTASGGTSYAWSSGQNTAAITIAPTTTTNYTVTVTNANGCTASFTRTVTVNANPSISIAGNLSICAGQSTTISVTPAQSSYSWSIQSPLTLLPDVTQAITVSPTATTTYVATANNAAGCSATASVTVVVNANPTASISGTTTICVGGSTVLTAAGGSSYTWSTGETTPSITVSPGSNSPYSVTVGTGSCTATASTTVTVNANPTVTISTPPSPICSGSAISLTASGASSYVWNTSENTATINPTISANTTFTVVGTAANGCTATASRTVTVTASPSVTISGNTSICRFETASITATAVGGTGFIWSVGGQTTASISVSPNNTTTYTLTATGSGGCNTVQPVTVTVTPAIGASITASSTNVCAGDTVLVSATSPACGSCTYQWSTGSTNQSNTFLITSPVLFRVTITGGSGCTDSASLSVNVTPAPSLNISQVPTACAGLPVSYSSSVFGGASPYTYFWNSGSATGVNNNFSFTPATAGTVIVRATVTDASGCQGTDTDTMLVSNCGTTQVVALPNGGTSVGGAYCAGTQVGLYLANPPANARYLWSTGDTSAFISPILNLIGTQIYTVTVSIPSGSTFTPIGSYSSDPIEVVPSTPLIASVGRTVICGSTDTTTLNLSPFYGSLTPPCPSCEFVLRRDGFVVGTYTGLPQSIPVTGSGNYQAQMVGCAQGNLMTVNQGQVDVSISAVPNTVDVCQGTPVIMVANTPCVGCNYLWSTGQTTTSVTATNPGTYRVTVSRPGSLCRDTASYAFTITAPSLDTVTFFPVGASETAANLHSMVRTITPLSARTLPTVYASPFITTSGSNYLFNASQAGVGLHPVIVTITQGSCTRSDTAYVRVIPAPTLRGLVRDYCSGLGITDTLLRDTNYLYATTGSLVTSTQNIMGVTAIANYTGPLTPINPNSNTEYYVFNPNAITGTFSILRVTYTTRIQRFNTLGQLIDSSSYIVGTIIDTQFTAAAATTQILRRDTLYCKNNDFQQILLRPAGGVFQIRQLNGVGANNITTFTATQFGLTDSAQVYINPFNLHQNENTDISYRLIYTYSQGGCVGRDSLSIIIPNPANTAFTAPSNIRQYCDDAPPVLLTPAQPGGSFFVNGVGINPPFFNPTALPPGQHLVSYERSNGFGCLSRTVDTFTVFPLPSLSFTPIPQTYCVYDPTVVVRANPIPGANTVGTLSMISRFGTQGVSNPFTFNPNMFAGDTLANQVQFAYVFADANGCLNRDTFRLTVNPQPVIRMTQLEQLYCQDPTRSINLNITPQGGVLTANHPLSLSNNIDFTAQIYRLTDATFSIQPEVITYIYQDSATACRDTVEQLVRVVLPTGGTASFVQAPPPTACFNGDTILVVARNTLTSPTNGASAPWFQTSAFTANGGIIRQTRDSAWFVPNQAISGDVRISYTYIDTTSLSRCARTISSDINIRTLPNLAVRYTAPFPARDTVCSNPFDSLRLFGVDRRFSDSVALPGPLTLFSGARVRGRFFFPNIVGNNLVIMSYTDANGCSNTIIDTVEVLDNPRPSIVGLGTQYCFNAPSLTFAVNPDYGAWRWNGIDTVRDIDYNGDTVVRSVALDRSLYQFHPNLVDLAGNPFVDLPLVYRVVHPNGCINSINQNVRISAQPTVALDSILYPDSLLCVNESPVPLRALVNGSIPSTAIFRENSVQTNIFEPSRLASGGSFAAGTRTITYEFNDAATGCSGNDTFQLTVLPSPTANLTNLSSIYCTYGTAVNLSAAPVTTNGGLAFDTLTTTARSSALVINGPQDFTFYPDSAGPGTYTFMYRVRDLQGCGDTVILTTSVSSLPSGVQILLPSAVRILSTDTVVCFNEPPFTVSGIPATGNTRFTLRNLSTNALDSFPGSVAPINTANLQLGDYRLNFTFANAVGCETTETIDFTVYPAPQAAFAQTAFCQIDTIRLVDVSTVNLSNPLNRITNRQWTYRGDQLNIRDTATMDSILYLTNEPATPAPVMLQVVSAAGCVDTAMGTAFIYAQPSANFQILGACAGDTLQFVPDVANGAAVSLEWDFTRSANDTRTATNVPISEVYATPGVYYPNLRVRTNNGNCEARDTQRLVVLPVVNNLHQTPYFQPFEDSARADWFQSEFVANPSQQVWQWGIPQGNIINGNSGAWSIRNGQPYDSVMVAASVYSPCFDFTQSRRPMIKLDYITNLYDVDGVVLEYYDEQLDTATAQPRGWQTLGNRGQGINWYNSSSDIFGLLNFKPLALGTVLDGWTLNSNGWETARYRLDQFRGQNKVRFRMIFGKMPNIPNADRKEGFAFDNVWIGERSRNVLLEHFANVNHPNIGSINRRIYDRAYDPAYVNDVVFVQYQTNVPQNSIDSINQLNSADHNARSLFYGASNAEAIVNGNFYRGPSVQVSALDLDLQMLEDPKFNITINPMAINLGQNQVNLNATVQAAQDLPSAPYVVYAMVAEDSVLNGGLLQRQTMRTFLPTHGQSPLYLQAFRAGDTVQLQRSWSVDASLYRIGRMQAIVFVQNEQSKEVYQVATHRNFNLFDPTVSTDPLPDPATVFSTQLFPNPAQDYFQVRWDQPLTDDYQWTVHDLRGVLLQQGQAGAGITEMSVQTQNFANGMYIFTIYHPSKGLAAQRQVIIAR